MELWYATSAISSFALNCCHLPCSFLINFNPVMKQAEFSCVDGDGTVPVESAMVNSHMIAYSYILVENDFK